MNASEEVYGYQRIALDSAEREPTGPEGVLVCAHALGGDRGESVVNCPQCGAYALALAAPLWDLAAALLESGMPADAFAKMARKNAAALREQVKA